jgi:pimeloyl-ACP methyl ester carboxylesterase
MTLPTKCLWFLGDRPPHLFPRRLGRRKCTSGAIQINPPLIFFHGIYTNFLMYGEWLFPELSKSYYCSITMDTIGDMGRSLPKDHDPTNGPKDEKETADWVLQVLKGIDVNQKNLYLLGFSFGCYIIATCVAQHYPERVEKIVLLAPVGVLAPVRKLWLAQAISFAMLSMIFPNWESLRLWFFGSMMADTNCMKNWTYPELREATDAIGGPPQVNLRPVAMDIGILKQITNACPTLMVIGQQKMCSRSGVGNRIRSKSRYEDQGVRECWAHVLL